MFHRTRQKLRRKIAAFSPAERESLGFAMLLVGTASGAVLIGLPGARALEPLVHPTLPKWVAIVAGFVGGALLGTGVGLTAWWALAWRVTVVKVRRGRLSPKSRRSWGVRGYYEDRRYTCIGCSAECTFTAEDQRQQYEVRKLYIWADRIRCQACQDEWASLKREIAEFPAELRRQPEAERLREMLRQLDRFKLLSDGKLDTALNNRIKKQLARRSGAG